MADSPSVFDDLLKAAPPLKSAPATPTGTSSVFDDLLSGAPPLKTPAPVSSSTDDSDDGRSTLPSSAYAGPTRYGRDANGRMVSKWDGSKWVGLFDGKPAGSPAKEEMGPDPQAQALAPPPSVPGMEQLGGTPPGPARPPLPNAPGVPGLEPLDRSTQPARLNPRTGLPMGPGSGPLAVTDIATSGGGKVLRGAERVAEPLQSFVVGQPGAPGMPRQSTLTPAQGKQLAQGGGEILSGVMELATPLVAGAAAAAPLQTAITLAAGAIADKGTAAGLKALGVAPEYADLGGTIAALLAGYAAAKVRLSPEQQNLIEVLRGQEAGGPDATGRRIDALKAMVDRGGTENERQLAQDLLKRKYGMDYGTVTPDTPPEASTAATAEPGSAPPAAAPRPPMGPPAPSVEGASVPPESGAPAPTVSQPSAPVPNDTGTLPSITKGSVLPSPASER